VYQSLLVWSMLLPAASSEATTARLLVCSDGQSRPTVSRRLIDESAGAEKELANVEGAAIGSVL